MRNNVLAGSLMGELWAMDPNRLNGLIETMAFGSDLAGFAAGVVSSPVVGQPASSNPGGTIAYIPITGVIMKHVPEFFSFLGIEATGAVQTGEAIKAALADDSIESIELLIDSPGGSIAGVQPLADLIHEAGQIKPVNAVVSDMAASAAYWLGSQANSIEANAGAMVGSVGVYRVMVDSSENAERQGFKVHLISSGEFKGAGTPGTELKPAALEREQRLIDDAANMFKAAIGRGRALTPEQIEAIATGETWFAEDAKRLGLIDMISAVELPEGIETIETPDPAEGEPMEGDNNAELELTPVADASSMQQEIEALQAQLEEKNAMLAAQAAEDDASKAALAAVIDGQKQKLIEKGIAAGQIVPAMVAQIETFAAFCCDDVQKLEGFIGALPVQIRPNAESEQPAAASRATLSESDLAVAKLLKIDPETFAENSDWRAISASGDLLNDDGGIIRTIGGN